MSRRLTLYLAGGGTARTTVPDESVATVLEAWKEALRDPFTATPALEVGGRPVIHVALRAVSAITDEPA